MPGARRTRLRLLGALWAALSLLAVSERARADDPARAWHTIETAHFLIHYYTLPHGGGEEPVAQRLAVVTENAWRKLTPVLGKGLNKKTHIVVTDDIDDYNGFAGVYPYPAITLYANSPDDRAELNDYDDWLTDLVMHEYTHILHTGTIGGPCAKIINAVLGLGVGTIYPPNQFQPRWGLEGLAVFEETARTAAGRLRNAIWDMYLRTQTLENRFQRIDQISVSPNQFPFGNAAYLYGSALTRYVAEHYGEGALLKMSRDYGSSCIPGGMSRSIKHVTGKTWIELYRDFKAELTDRYQKQRAAILQRGPLTATRELTQPDPSGPARPVFTPDGKEIIVLRYDGFTRQRIARLPVNGPPAPKIGTPMPWQKTEVLTDAAGGPSLSGDGRYIAFHEQTVWHTNYFFNDVFLYDRVKHEKRRLTDGARAWNPAISPDGREVIFEMTGNSSRGLGRLVINNDGDSYGPIETIIPVANMEHAYTPVYSPDGKSIAFSWWRRGGFRDIYTMDLKTRDIVRITNDRSYDLEPRYSPDGKLLYFVSDRTGVYNLFAFEFATGKTWQVTNVLEGVFDPAISPDGKLLAFVGFHSDGYDLQTAVIDRATWREAEPALIDRPDGEVPPYDGPTLPHRWYNPLSTLIPWTWSPYANPDGYGEIIGFKLAGSDAVGRHAWSLQLGFGTGRADDVQFAANYSYTGLWPSLNLGVSRALQKRAGEIINGVDIGWNADVWSVGTSADLPIYRHVVEYSDLIFSYDFSTTRNETKKATPDPSALIPVYPSTGNVAGLAATWVYSNARRYQYSISTEEGRYIALNLAIGTRVLGSQFETYSASWYYNEWIPIPWPTRFLRNHVLWLAYSGGISGGDPNHVGNFYLGGYPSQNLLQSIYDFSRPGTASLRGYGYASQFGDQFHVLNAEYRFPILWIERSVETFPLYLRRLHAKAFADYGGAFNSGFSFSKLKLGVGAEAILEIDYAYYYGAALQLGYAHGVNAGGGNQVYFLLNAPF
ncbi:MAG TPA: BamA/TamA family outer membrane protein [Polyangia bacterium]|nr:BamA/TamA family outer membrane protein [Polyangia bacterium]